MILKFNAKEVQRLLDDSKNATERKTSLDDPTGSPGLWLVGDMGIYFMSNSKEGIAGENHTPETPNHFVVYANECNPHDNEDWYYIKRHSFGGDDGIIFVSAEQIEPCLTNNPKIVEIDLTPETIGFLAAV